MASLGTLESQALRRKTRHNALTRSTWQQVESGTGSWANTFFGGGCSGRDACAQTGFSDAGGWTCAGKRERAVIEMLWESY